MKALSWLQCSAALVLVESLLACAPGGTVGFGGGGSGGSGSAANGTGNGQGVTSGVTGATTSGSSSKASSTGAGPGVTSSTGSSGITWTQIYNSTFGPSGTASCTGGSCHTNTKSGFKCGTSASTCYTGFVNSGYIAPGANASTSALVDPNQSCLCGSLGGNMPIGNSCISSSELQNLKAWLATGAPNN